ncbi:hypothetical protein PRBEI_2001714700 [Prionailurus iriomotensis]
MLCWPSDLVGEGDVERPSLWAVNARQAVRAPGASSTWQASRAGVARLWDPTIEG